MLIRLRNIALAAIAFAVLGGPLVVSALAQDGGGRVIELDELVIEGKISKPQVFYILGRSTLRYKNLELERSFVDRIVENARQNPF